jgi:putative glutathione S-transferase
LAVLRLKGLDSVIGVSVVDPTWRRTSDRDDHMGWVFDDQFAEPFYGAKSIRELYERAESNYQGKFTVPVLWDTKNCTVVNNESWEIMQMFNSEFNLFAKNPMIDLYPSHLKAEIDQINKWVYESINNGVYRCGFAKSQEAYDSAIVELYKGLDRADSLLENNKFLVGNQMTLVDIRLIMTLIRFDEVYVVYFKCNQKCIREYTNLHRFCKEMYSNETVRSIVNMEHIKRHYFTSHKELNPYAIIPRGPDFLKSLAQN